MPKNIQPWIQRKTLHVWIPNTMHGWMFCFAVKTFPFTVTKKVVRNRPKIGVIQIILSEN